MMNPTREGLWTLARKDELLHAELVVHGDEGTELELFRDGESYFNRRYETRDQALEDAAWFRKDLEDDGWLSLK